MLHLRRRIDSLLLQPASPPYPTAVIAPLSSLRRLLSTTAADSPKPFAVEDYLVATCGLTRPQAAKASKKLTRLRSPSKPDAVLAFLSGLGLSRPDIAAAVAADPRLLCADVKNNLAKRVGELRGLGLSGSQIARLVPLARTYFRSTSLTTKLSFWLPVFGSFEKILNVLRKSSLLGTGVETVAKPNLAFLKQRGINACDVARISTMYSSWLFTFKPMYLREVVARVEELGLDRSSGMFPRGLIAMASISKETAARKMRLLEELEFSQDDLLVIMRKCPELLHVSDKKIRRTVEFLKMDVGLEERYIAQRPVLFKYSLERRLLPRHCLINVLRTKGLLNYQFDYYWTAVMGEKDFLQRFVDPYKAHIPGLADAYASSCSAEAANGIASLLGLYTEMDGVKVCAGKFG